MDFIKENGMSFFNNQFMHVLCILCSSSSDLGLPDKNNIFKKFSMGH